MIEIIPTNNKYEEYDSCGNTMIAVLKVDRITIPLCMRCLDELNESLSEFNNTTFWLAHCEWTFAVILSVIFLH